MILLALNVNVGTTNKMEFGVFISTENRVVFMNK
jgi:hypothetical protein